MGIEEKLGFSEERRNERDSRASNYGSPFKQIQDWYKEHIVEINHYSNRILIDSWVPLLGTIILGPLALIGAAAVKIAEPDKPAFYRKKLYTSDKSEQYQLKTRTMKLDADSQRDALIEQGVLNPAGLKSENDPRITPVGKILRKTGLDEVWQLGDLVKHVYSRKGFFYNPKRHYHYSVAPRPQAQKNIDETKKPSKKVALAKGRTGITGPYQVREGDEGECAIKFHEYFENEWIIPKAFKWLLKTPIVMIVGHNA